ncbi:DUF1569 domain-containing protein [uncultured Polaribacter sp.]|uniref:DUF1569 domain-containing protein n=1 Tax=uncultured Polaribacter sp. TaxID=174711 RepID=UPI002601EAFE|nr:DUF1569 domain-containing protein [uncultured Polaribacter sp.]
MLDKELQLINKYTNHYKTVNLKVSKSSVGWHLDHSLKVINLVNDTIKKSKESDFKKEFSGLRLLTFTFGFFPRGKARSPKRVLPPEVILKEDIENQLKIAKEHLKSFEDLDDNQFFTHPLFKQLNKRQTQKFLKLHTNHHLKIIKEILR